MGGRHQGGQGEGGQLIHRRVTRRLLRPVEARASVAAVGYRACATGAVASKGWGDPVAPSWGALPTMSPCAPLHLMHCTAGPVGCWRHGCVWPWALRCRHWLGPRPGRARWSRCAAWMAHGTGWPARLRSCWVTMPRPPGTAWIARCVCRCWRHRRPLPASPPRWCRAWPRQRACGPFPGSTVSQQRCRPEGHRIPEPSPQPAPRPSAGMADTATHREGQAAAQ